MRIEHLALYVCDLEKMKIFYTKYFNAKSGALYHNKNTGFRSYFLSFDDGARLEIMTKPGLAPSNMKNSYGYAHLALKTSGEAEVNALTQLLSSNGFKVLSGPRTTGDGYYESCILDPEDNIIEITA